MQVACILQEHCKTRGPLNYQSSRDFVVAESVERRREFVVQWTDHSGSISTVRPRSPLLILLPIQTILFCLRYIYNHNFVDYRNSSRREWKEKLDKILKGAKLLESICRRMEKGE